MIRVRTSLIALLLTGCSVSTPDGMPLSDGTTVYPLSCENGWQDCHTAAQKICGRRGYEEVDRVIDGTVSTAGRLDPMHRTDGGNESHIYSENPRTEVFGRFLTIRCKLPESQH